MVGLSSDGSSNSGRNPPLSSTVLRTLTETSESTRNTSSTSRVNSRPELLERRDRPIIIIREDEEEEKYDSSLGRTGGTSSSNPLSTRSSVGNATWNPISTGTRSARTGGDFPGVVT